MPKTTENQPYLKKYTEEEIQKALAAVKNGMSKKLAAAKFNVPRATIQFRLSNNFIKTRPGPSTVLTAEEESEIVGWLMASSRKGFPRRKSDILDTVQEFLVKNPRENSFIDNRPGKGWFKLFLQRHTELSLRQSEAVTSASSKISETDIRNWFRQIEDYLKEMQYDEILNDPSRVFNGDETGFLFNPKNIKVIAPKGDKNVYEVEHAPSKTSLTVMFTFSASGVTTPPMVVYPLKRMRNEILRSVPESWGVGMSENGWMKAETFYNYIKNVLYPFLVNKNTQFPIILFVDGHKSHTTLELSQMCEKLGIILISLYPNATRILQPADVAAFRPIKSAWKKAVLDWRKENLTKTLTKVDFGPILVKIVDNHINPNIVKNGFRACGLVPWNPDAIDYSKCLGGTRVQQANNKNAVSTDNINISFDNFQNIVGPTVMRRLQNGNVVKSGEGKALLKIYKYFLLANPTRQEEQLDDDFVHIDVRENDLSNINVDENISETQSVESHRKEIAKENITEAQSKEIDEERENITEKLNKNTDREETQKENIKNVFVGTHADINEFNNITDDVTEMTHFNINGVLVPIDNVPICMPEEVAMNNSTEVNTSNKDRTISPMTNTNAATSAAEFIPEPCCSFIKQFNESTPQKQPPTLRETLIIPKTPIRISKMKIIKQPFVLTSKVWQKIQTDKQDEKNKIIIEKEERKRIREEKSRERKETIEAKRKKKAENTKTTKNKAKNATLIKKTKKDSNSVTIEKEWAGKKHDLSEPQDSKPNSSGKPIILSNVIVNSTIRNKNTLTTTYSVLSIKDIEVTDEIQKSNLEKPIKKEKIAESASKFKESDQRYVVNKENLSKTDISQLLEDDDFI